MGEVYRALDTRLDRHVALKVLPTPFAADPDRVARFQREAKAVAALSHPNILVIHDYGTDTGVFFAVMELLEGETLRQHLDQGPIPLGRTLEIGAAIAEGLAAAHDQGIIHRDLKPENLFLTKDGRVKLLDFGLARLEVQKPGDAPTQDYVNAQTSSGVVLGTPGYMAPEQVRGMTADVRSDIFSLGCVLYEMLSGRRAFARETAAETMTAILHDDPPPIAESGRNVPAAVDRLARHCLEKNPHERLQSARDLMFQLRDLAATGQLAAPLSTPRRFSGLAAAVLLALLLASVAAYRWWSAPGAQDTGAAPEIASVSVLPFINDKTHAATEYLSDGLTDSLINSLSELPRLRVIARASAFRFKGRDVDPQDAGRQLGVQAVLVGDVTERDGELRVNVELVLQRAGLLAKRPIPGSDRGARVAVQQEPSNVSDSDSPRRDVCPCRAESQSADRPSRFDRNRSRLFAAVLESDLRGGAGRQERIARLVGKSV
jgi:serine/threonine protein kinase